MLFYYCKTDVLKSILSNKSIWLSDMTQSNDAYEIDSYIDYVVSFLDKSKSLVYEEAKKQLESKRKIYYCLAICFTDKKDSYYQWCEYGDMGKGFAIGFDEKKFYENFCEHPFLNMNPVKYYKDFSDDLIQEIIRGYIKELDDIEKKNMDSKKEVVSACAEWADSVLVNDVPFIKSACFIEERETRFAYSRYLGRNKIGDAKESSLVSKIGFRTSERSIIPYLNLELYSGTEKNRENLLSDIIREIIVGPENDTRIETIRVLLGKNGFKTDIDVYKSNIPLKPR